MEEGCLGEGSKGEEVGFKSGRPRFGVDKSGHGSGSLGFGGLRILNWGVLFSRNRACGGGGCGRFGEYMFEI